MSGRDEHEDGVGDGGTMASEDDEEEAAGDE